MFPCVYFLAEPVLDNKNPDYSSNKQTHIASSIELRNNTAGIPNGFEYKALCGAQADAWTLELISWFEHGFKACQKCSNEYRQYVARYEAQTEQEKE